MKFRLTKDLSYFIVIAVLIATLGQLYYQKEVHFSPARVYYNKDTELNTKLISLIQDSNEYVYFAIYTFTRYDIKDALLGAKHRGVKVIGLTDKDQIQKIDSQEKIVQQLREAGIPVYVQDHSKIMHLKVLVTEKAYASGSYNWTASATTGNDEVLEIGTDPTMHKEYQDILERLFYKYGTQ